MLNALHCTSNIFLHVFSVSEADSIFNTLNSNFLRSLHWLHCCGFISEGERSKLVDCGEGKGGNNFFEKNKNVNTFAGQSQRFT